MCILVLAALSVVLGPPSAERTPIRAGRAMMTLPSSDSRDSLRIALQAAPVAASIAMGTVWFPLLYVPLLALGRAAEAEEAATIFLATLLYAAAATLADIDGAPLLGLVAINLTCSGVLLSVGELDAESANVDVTPTDAFADFDRRLGSKPER